MIVIDASVGIKLLKQGEVGAKEARELYRNHIEGKNQIIVPSLFFLEIANVLVTTKSISHDDMISGLHFLNKSRFSIHSFTKDTLLLSAEYAKKYTTTVYDMLYAVVALQEKCPFVTADEKFYSKTKFSNMRLLA